MIHTSHIASVVIPDRMFAVQSEALEIDKEWMWMWQWSGCGNHDSDSHDRHDLLYLSTTI